MTVVFMSLLALTIGRRDLLLPPLVIGVASAFYWRYAGDLSLYILVQFGTMLAIPLLLLRNRPARPLLWCVVILYAVAKILELFDHPIAAVIATGGHPWKHIAAALTLLCYIEDIARRRELLLPQRSDRVDVNGAPSREPGSERCDREHGQEDYAETHRIGGFNAIENLPE